MQYVDSDKLAKAKVNGVYADAEGVHHFLKAKAPMPRNWTLVEEVDSLGARREVAEAQEEEANDGAKAEDVPENKADRAPANKR
jgi:hypothetical protein